MGLVEPKALVPFGSYRKRSFAGHQSIPRIHSWWRPEPHVLVSSNSPKHRGTSFSAERTYFAASS